MMSPAKLTFFALALGGYLTGALLFGYYARANYDEEIFLYAGNLLYEGKVPYRDFPFIFGPMMPLVYGIPQTLLEPSLLVGRMTSVALSLLTAVSGGYLAYRFSRQMGMLVFLALIMLNPLGLWVFTVAKTESLVTPLVMMSLAVWIMRPRQPAALVVAASLLLWAVAVRQTVVLAFLVLTLMIFYQLRLSKRDLALAAGALGIQAFALFGVIALLARGNMFFHMVEAHWVYRETSYRLGERLVDIITYYPRELLLNFAVVLLPASVILAVLAARWRQGWRPNLKALDTDPFSAQTLLLVAGILLFLPHLLLRVPWAGYFVVSSTILAAMVGVSVVSANHWLPERFAGRAASALLLSIVVAGGISFGFGQATYLSNGRPAVEIYADVNDYVSDTVGANERLLSFRPGLRTGGRAPAGPRVDDGLLFLHGVTLRSRR